MKTPPRLLLLSTFYALYAARELAMAWQSAPLERLSPVLLGLWLTPCLAWWRREPAAPKHLVGVGLALCVSGQLVAVNLLSQLGLITIFCAWRGQLTVLAFLSGLLWLPVGGWLGAHLPLPPLGLFGLRLLGVGLALIAQRKRDHEQTS